jgi:hypothetical protein
LRLNTGTRVGDLVDVSGPREGGGVGATDAGTATFDSDLRTLRRRVVRRWALALAVRCAVGALAVALVPALLAAFGVIGWVWAVAVPVVVFLVAFVVLLTRRPSLAEVARLLDDRLGLFDVTATALQVERAGEAIDEGPAAPVYAEAAALLRAGASSWRPRARLGSRELVAAAGLIVALAVIVVLGSGGSSSSSKVTATAKLPPGLRHHPAGGPNSISPPLVPPRVKRHGEGAKRKADQKRFHPYGIYDYGFEGKKKIPHYNSKLDRTGVHYANGRPSSAGKPQEQFAAPGNGEGNEAREKAEEEAIGGHAKNQPKPKGETGSEPPPDQTLKSLTGGAVPPSGSVSPVPNGPNGGKPQGNPGAGAPSNSSAPGAQSSSESPSSQSGGRPSGSKSAGTQRAGLGGNEQGTEGGREGGDELALKAGFAAVKSGKAASGKGPRNAQGGGGPGKSAGIGGSAFEEDEAGSLGYVPPDAGVAPTADPGLFARYLNALAAIAGRHW